MSDWILIGILAFLALVIIIGLNFKPTDTDET